MGSGAPDSGIGLEHAVAEHGQHQRERGGQVEWIEQRDIRQRRHGAVLGQIPHERQQQRPERRRRQQRMTVPGRDRRHRPARVSLRLISHSTISIIAHA
ncbi:hypothetical protein LP420_23090 [Massilia sp. B-10]|nr:hypothetical protein LP420_23090 [Massilia sp. B-10]